MKIFDLFLLSLITFFFLSSMFKKLEEIFLWVYITMVMKLLVCEIIEICKFKAYDNKPWYVFCFISLWEGFTKGEMSENEEMRKKGEMNDNLMKNDNMS